MKRRLYGANLNPPKCSGIVVGAMFKVGEEMDLFPHICELSGVGCTSMFYANTRQFTMIGATSYVCVFQLLLGKFIYYVSFP